MQLILLRRPPYIAYKKKNAREINLLLTLLFLKTNFYKICFYCPLHHQHKHLFDLLIQMDMKKLLFSTLIIFGSAQLFIQGVTLYTGANNLPPHLSHPSSSINNDLPVKLMKPPGIMNNVLKFETGTKSRAIANDFNFKVLPYNIAKISGLSVFYDPNLGLNSYTPFNTYNWRWRLVEWVGSCRSEVLNINNNIQFLI